MTSLLPSRCVQATACSAAGASVASPVTIPTRDLELVQRAEFGERPDYPGQPTQVSVAV